MKTRPATRRERTAYHEAGHVVMSHLFGRKVLSATIHPTEDAEGYVRNSALRNLDLDKPRVRREVMILLAGGIADGLLVGQVTKDGCEGDYESALELMMRACGSAGQIERLVDGCFERVHRLLKEPNNWALVEAIASALLAHGTLLGAEIRQLIGNLKGETAA